MKLTCPVCDRTAIDGNICPNCETDLSSIRLLMTLPEVAEPQRKWLLALVIVLLLGVMGWMV
ncbi:hypothetical protein [Acaryochloris sp. IP29b_bin.137]|uniref:hypothetical protein n=1 Tax=Acaryochloris sp. IP29b_bin.137 TaxID=2969217 RepID=UPI00262F89F0|nr:hypothetical protein [Acaryochloris sp. IP29b_bin.137]